MNRHIQGMLLTKIRAAERAIAPLLTRGLTEISGAADKQGLVQELGQFAAIAEKTLRHEEQRKYGEIADTLLQAARALPVPADAAQTAPACALIADVLQETERMLSTEKLKKIFVFLPYKASMWDSLESIYLAAAEDKEQCEPYVVPIPYADLNPDHTAKEWHCEAREYPENIPVEDWHDFTIDTLRLMRPDAIFIHNPYDDLNRVTSIHPQYYSEKLKTATDCLVYVPYDVPITVTGEAFIQTKGVVNADYVIVKDKANKEQFERYYPGGNPPQGKILPLGSPKIDKVLSVKREDFTLPKAWQDIVVGKKVILYNTSISAYLQNTDKVCPKLRSVLGYFKAHQDEVALWWRPHPLMEATFQSMRPDFYSEYKSIVEQYKQEGWGIYDDTAELDRAIACSDAYYGDMSSVVPLCQAAGKPVVIQDIRCPNADKEDGVSVWALAYYLDQDELWFIHGRTSLLFRYSLLRNQMELIGKIPQEKAIEELSIIKMIHYENYLFFIPFNGKYLGYYNIAERKFHPLIYPERYHQIGPLAFCAGIVQGEFLYCISAYSCEILRVNMSTLAVELVFDGAQEVQAHDLAELQPIGNVTPLGQNQFAAVFTGTNIFYIFDMQENRARFYALGASDQKFVTVAECGSHIFAQESSENRIWAGNLDNIEGLHPVEKNDYQSLRYVDGTVMLADDVNSSGWCLLDDQMHIQYKNDGIKNQCLWNYSYQSMTLQGSADKLYGFDCSSNEFVLVDKKTGAVEKRRIRIGKQLIKAIIEDYAGDGYILPEYPGLVLSELPSLRGKKRRMEKCAPQVLRFLKEG